MYALNGFGTQKGFKIMSLNKKDFRKKTHKNYQTYAI